MTDPKRPPNIGLILDSGATSARLIQHFGKPIDRPPLDLVSFPPDMTGPHGRAWLMKLEMGRLKYGIAKEKDGTVAMWCIEAPWAHPLWHSYAMVLVHLRPLDGGQPPKMYLEGATHEFWLYALNAGDDKERPSRDQLIRFGAIGRDGAPSVLTPIQYATQFIAESDEAAKKRVTASVQSIIDGILSPDTDAAADWRSIWGETMVRPEFR